MAEKRFVVGEIWNTSMPNYSKVQVTATTVDGSRVLQFRNLSDDQVENAIYGGWNPSFTSRDEFLTAVYRRRHPHADTQV